MERKRKPMRHRKQLTQSSILRVKDYLGKKSTSSFKEAEQ